MLICSLVFKLISVMPTLFNVQSILKYGKLFRIFLKKMYFLLPFFYNIEYNLSF